MDQCSTIFDWISKYTYLFLWLGITCPTNYILSNDDGRTCIGTTEKAIEIDKNMCADGFDDRRTPIADLNPKVILSIQDEM